MHFCAQPPIVFMLQYPKHYTRSIITHFQQTFGGKNWDLKPLINAHSAEMKKNL